MKLLKTINTTISEKEEVAKSPATVVDKGESLFKKITNGLDAKPITTKNVSDHLSAAHDDDDGVDTITFGLETENGDIVKVFVNAQEADGFEEALSKLLGAEDSIESALDKLKNDFDVVDIKWPSGEEEQDGEKSTADIDDLINALPDTKDDEKEEKEPKKNEDSLGTQFLNRVLKEETLLKGEAGKFESELSNRYQQLAFQGAFVLGIPIEVLKLKRAAYKRNLKDVGNELMTNSQARIWLKRLVTNLTGTDKTDTTNVGNLGEIGTGSDSKAEVKEANGSMTASDNFISDKNADQFKQMMQNRIQLTIGEVILALGVPPEAIKSRRQEVKQNIRELSYRILKNPREKMLLNMVAEAFGIETHGNGVKQTFVAKDSIEEQVAGATLDTKETMQDSYIEMVIELATALGIPEVNLAYRQSALRQALKNKKMKLKNLSNIRMKSKILLSLLTDAPLKEAEYDDEDGDDIDLSKYTPKKKQIENEAANLGEWSISAVGNKTILSIKSVKLEIDLDKIIDAFADGKSLVLKQSNNKKVVFSPINRGTEYIVKAEQYSEDHPEGILLSKKSISRILNF